MIQQGEPLEVTLIKSPTHQVRLISEKVLKKIIYQLETCQPTPCANLSHQLRRAMDG